MRAHKDPSIAAKWLLGIEPFKSTDPKTFLYEQDLQKSEERNAKFKDKMYQQFIENFLFKCYTFGKICLWRNKYV